jgi:ABC-2 type transport system permease protein
LARAERDQTLAVLAVTPLSRRKLAGSWWLLVVLVASVGAIAAVVGVLVGGPLAGASVGVDRVLLATLPMMVFAVLIGSIALLVSTLTGAPGMATGAGWIAILISFLANSLAELIDGLNWLSSINPWSWHGAGEAITDDFDSTSFALLVVSTLVVGSLAIAKFERRNLHL